MSTAESSAEATEHTVTADDGARLHLQRWGQGPPLLVLHGLGYASWAAEALAEHLGDHLTLWSLDTRGSGRSDEPPGPYSIDRFAEDAGCALQLIARLAAEPVHLLGYSMGGYTAQVLALKRPHLLRTLTLLSTSAGGPGAVDVPAPTKAAWEQHADLAPEGFARATMPLSLAAGWPERHPEEFERLVLGRLLHPTSARAWRAQYDACAAFLRDGVPAERITVPALVIHGVDDRVVPVENGRQLHARIPASTYVEVDGGHLIHLEDPQEIGRLIAGSTSSATSTATSPVPSTGTPLNHLHRHHH